MKSLEITVEPKVLIWARKSIGKSVDDIAQKLKIDKTIINQWEIGQRSVRLSQLEKLANIYKRPLAAFFLPEPPKEIPLPKDYRTLPLENRRVFSSKTLLAIRRAERIRRIAVELAESMERKIFTEVVKASIDDAPEILALKVREHLGISVDMQSKWRDERIALSEWRKIVESKDVIVLYASMPIEDTRGFSLSEKIYPVIVVNSQDSYTARIFSLFHEYAHLMINNSGICDMADRFYLSDEDKRIERFCNYFAGAFLVPKQDLINHRLLKTLKSDRDISDDYLKELAGDFKVSQEVILRRLVIIGRSSEKLYLKKREEWEARAKEQRKLKRSGRKIPSRACVQENGVLFVSLVLNSYGAEKITLRDISDYLGIRLKHLPKVEQLIAEKVL